MNTKTQHLVDELSPNSKNTKKMSKVFENIEDMGKDISLDPDFKTHLQNRLENLIEIQSMTYQVEKRRWYLMAGTFASFLFLGVFVYYMSGTFFSTPLSQEIREIYAPKIQEQDVLLREISPQENISETQNTSSLSEKLGETEVQDTELSQPETQASIVGESQGESVVENTQSEKGNDSETQETSSDVSQDALSGESDELDIETQIDNTSSEASASSGLDSRIEDTESLQKTSDTFQDDASMDSLGDEFQADMMMDIFVKEEEPEEKEIDFKGYCREIGGIYVHIEPLEECHKDNQICTRDDFKKSFSCSFTPVENDEIKTQSDETTQESEDQ